MKVRFAVTIGSGPPHPSQLGEVAALAEERGFDTVWLSDVPSLPGTEPGLGVAYVAAVTERLHLGANFIPFGVEPFLLAHRLAQVDRLTGGRLLVTLVPGLDIAAERAALGTADRHRGRMMEDLVPKLRRWWAGGTVDGTEARLAVRPVQDPLEVWLGGSGPDAVGRAGRVADGWLGAHVSPPRAGRIRQAIEEEAGKVGRRIDPEHFGLSIGYARQPEDLQKAVRLPVRRVPVEDVEPHQLVPVGRAGLRRLVGELVDQGLSKFVVRPVAPVGSTEQWTEELGWLSDAVLDMQS